MPGKEGRDGLPRARVSSVIGACAQAVQRQVWAKACGKGGVAAARAMLFATGAAERKPPLAPKAKESALLPPAAAQHASLHAGDHVCRCVPADAFQEPKSGTERREHGAFCATRSMHRKWAAMVGAALFHPLLN